MLVARTAWTHSMRGMSAYSPMALGSFTQTPPQLHNPFTNDKTLQRYLRRHLPTELHTEISADLHRFGDRIVAEVDAVGRACDQEHNLPRLTQYSAYGERVDTLSTCAPWRRQKEIAAEEGVVAIGYDRQSYGEHARLYQYAKLLMYTPSSGLYSCPLAMTDGCAKIIESLGIEQQTGEAFERLTSRDPQRMWTSGQWMTERMGGSDVGGGTDTEAVLDDDGMYRLYGHKWFSSATDADVTMTLARVRRADGTVDAGSKGLSLFFAHMRTQDGKLNNVQMMRLKDKLGTRQVPTAELLLHGMTAALVSPVGRGVKCITHMLNTTRMHNAVASVGYMSRIVSLAHDYGGRRTAFGRHIIDWPLHARTLAHMTVHMTAAKLFLLDCVRMSGRVEVNSDADDQALLRLLTPILKLHTAKTAMAVVSEGLECFGGIGYMEDSGLPVYLRDAQVTPIWEGTTNVLAMDVVRVLATNTDSIATFAAHVRTRIDVGDGVCEQVRTAARHTARVLDVLTAWPMDAMALSARDFAFTVGNVHMASLLIDSAATDGDGSEAHMALMFTESQSFQMLHTDPTKYDSSDNTDRLILSGVFDN